MKATLPQLKNKVKKMTANTGWVLHKNNPYYANASQILLMRTAMVSMLHAGMFDPKRNFEVSETQVNKLNDWFDSLERKYLI